MKINSFSQTIIPNYTYNNEGTTSVPSSEVVEGDPSLIKHLFTLDSPTKQIEDANTMPQILKQLFNKEDNFSQKEMNDSAKSMLDTEEINLKQYNEIVMAINVKFQAELNMNKAYMGLIEN